MATQRVHHQAAVGVRQPKRGRARQRSGTIGRILAAAEQAFAERGLAGSRTDQIAHAAHVNKALLYYYFSSKQQLYGAVLDSLFSQQQAAVGVAHDSHAAHRETLLAYVNGYFDFVIVHPNYPRLVQREMMTRGPHLQRIVRDYWGPSQRRLVSAIESGIKAGEFRPGDPLQTVLSIIAMTVFYFAAAPVLGELWGRDTLRPRAIEARRQAVLDFLEHGLFVSPARKR